MQNETIKMIISRLDVEPLDEDTDLAYILYDEGICEYISEFTGETQTINDDGYFEWCGGNHKIFKGDSFAYVPLTHYPTLFKKAYNNMEEIIDELESKLDKYLPEDFDYRSRVCHICGTYHG